MRALQSPEFAKRVASNTAAGLGERGEVPSLSRVSKPHRLPLAGGPASEPERNDGAGGSSWAGVIRVNNLTLAAPQEYRKDAS